MGTVYLGDNLSFLKKLASGSVTLVYADPPFRTNRIRVDENGRYNDVWQGIDHYLEWLAPRLREIYRILSEDGTFYLHLDRRSVHYVRLLMDDIFGANNFQNEIIWHYTGGGRGSRHFPHKHDNILVYHKTRKYKFNVDAVREPYAKTSGYARSGIRARSGKFYSPHPLGKVLDDVWFIPIVNPLSPERTGYPNQKPEELLRRIIVASSDKGDIVLDPFCGSGTTLVAAHKLERQWIGMDSSPEAISICIERLKAIGASVQLETKPFEPPLEYKYKRRG